ncbi:DUF6159 family protein [Nocardia xishanensis]|uniref:DUF6159 family protein n=1 Tax=Nocardia xishanensis TaxID=238964 RepID=UPI00082B4AD4|nr:DUF6159 family protein [Nocardia xishanensis]
MAFAAARTMLRTGWGVLTSHRALVAYPVRSAVTGAVVTGVLFVSIGADVIDGSSSATPLLLAGACYLLMVIVTTFGNAALIAQADNVLRGGYPGAARRIPMGRWPAILLWALATATVLPVLRLVEHDFRDMRTARGRHPGTAWADVAELALPKIVLEGRNPIGALQDSRWTLDRAWGTDVVSSTRLGMVGYTLVLVGVSVSVLVGAVLGALAQARLGVPYGTAIGLWLGLAVYITALVFVSAANAVYQAALYHYSVDGRTPPAFAADLTRAFQP